MNSTRRPPLLSWRFFPVVLAAFAAAPFATPAARAAGTDIRPAPGGKRLLFVDGNDIRDAPGGKRLAYVDEKSIRPEPGGKRLLFIDGDSVRPEPGGVRLLYVDGPALRRKPGGPVLLHVKHPDVRPKADGERALFIDGPELTRPQLVAALYVLKPELFELTAEEEAALKKAAAAAAAEANKDPAAGTYNITVFSSSDDTQRAGKVVVEKKGDLYAVAFQYKDGPAWQGVGVRDKDQILVALGPEKTISLGVFDVASDGALAGAWMPYWAPGYEKSLFGAEKLKGAADLGGAYQITDAKQPGRDGKPYKGAVTVTKQEATIGNSYPTYLMTYDFGTAKLPAVGVRVGDKLFVCSGSGKDFAVLQLKVDSSSLVGDFYTNTKAKGFYTLTK